MPKVAAKPGYAHFVIASKTEKGSRAEMIAQFSEKKARLIWKLAQMSDAEIDKTLALLNTTARELVVENPTEALDRVQPSEAGDSTQGEQK